MTTSVLTARCQEDEFSTGGLLAALESAWAAIRERHVQVPGVVLVVGSGSPARASGRLRLGHFAASQWQSGPARLAEVFVSGEGLNRAPAEVLTTLLHEAAHALAHVRGIQDTSRQGRWHNKQFALLAAEVGLIASKDDKLGWSPCTIQPSTVDAYRKVVTELTTAMRAYRHLDVPAEKNKSASNNGVVLVCSCPRKLRASAAVAEEGPIICGVCDTYFRPEDEPGEPS
jgi:hypothetical protein